MTQQQVAEGGQPSCDGTAEVKRPREEQRFFGVVEGRGTFVSLFDCCVFSASLSLLTDARPQQKKRGGMCSPVRKRVATATRDGTGRQRVRLLLFLFFFLYSTVGGDSNKG